MPTPKRRYPVKAVTHFLPAAAQENPLLHTVLELLNADQEIRTLWKVVNVHAVKRLNMTDHGPVHFQIVAQNSLTLLRLLVQRGVVPSIVRDFKLSLPHAELVVLLASFLHDIGMAVHRKGHEEFSIILTHSLLPRLLSFLSIEERTVVSAEVLHAIISHRRDGQPLTIEAGVVRVGDALDMTKGRTRLPYRSDKLDIHSVSALAIDAIQILAGESTPIVIEIVMNHTAGIFQVDDLLKEKVRGSGLEEYLQIKVYIDKGHGRELFKDFYRRAKTG